MSEVMPQPGLNLGDASGEAAVLRVYRQIFGVLARESGAMVPDPGSIDIDEALLTAFADAGSAGLTVEQALARCASWPPSRVSRRFEVLRDYGALIRVVDRAHERHYRAAFAPYVMVLFLRRMADQGGQSEVHQLLSMEHASIQGPQATEADARLALRNLTNIFRLLGNELAILAAGASTSSLGESAQLLWGNSELLCVADDFHRTALARWPQLDRHCTELRLALAGYIDAIKAAADRLIDQAGNTQALGLLPAESWRGFARTATSDELAAVLDGLSFDAPAPWFSPGALIDAVAAGNAGSAVRLAPPRPASAEPAASAEPPDDTAELRAAAEAILGESAAVSVAPLLSAGGDWSSARRVLAELTACHQHPDLPYELSWVDELAVHSSAPSWASRGTFRRTTSTVAGTA
ncbi:MAG: hypothetical protein ACRC0L_03125 [Angustibacter sp.]